MYVTGLRRHRASRLSCSFHLPGVHVNKTICFVLGALMAVPLAVVAQQTPTAPAAPPANPISASEAGIYRSISGNVVRAAEEMPEENYSFKPTPDVRSFGQMVGHEADANYMFCSMATGDKNPSPGVEKTKTSKADLVAALKDAVAYCTKTYGGMTDTQGAAMTKFMNFQVSKLSLLSINTAHTDEHYGNMVTYLRIKGLVPPSSQGQGQRPQSSSTSD